MSKRRVTYYYDRTPDAPAPARLPLELGRLEEPGRVFWAAGIWAHRTGFAGLWRDGQAHGLEGVSAESDGEGYCGVGG